MPNPPVPASTKIRYTRVRHIETERLLARLAWLQVNKGRLARECDGRVRMRALARELLTIHHELCERGVHHV